MHRRSFSTLAVATLAGTKIAGPASAQNVSDDLETQLQRFKQFPGATSFRIDVGDDKLASHAPGHQLFVASTIKTFILCQYLRDVEAGRLSEFEQLSVDDNVRTESSPVFGNLTGTTEARSILEAMIAHSDNTATDIALLQVDPDRVRSFIAAEGFRATLIPDSTRRWFSYNLGAPLGVDIGWSGVQQVLATEQPLGPPPPSAQSPGNLGQQCGRHGVVLQAGDGRRVLHAADELTGIQTHSPLFLDELAFPG
jgi:beta-lactamase class A